MTESLMALAADCNEKTGCMTDTSQVSPAPHTAVQSRQTLTTEGPIMTPTSDYQTVERVVNDYRGIILEQVRQRRYEIVQPDGTIGSIWVDQPVVKEGE